MSGHQVPRLPCVPSIANNGQSSPLTLLLVQPFRYDAGLPRGPRLLKHLKVQGWLPGPGSTGDPGKEFQPGEVLSDAMLGSLFGGIGAGPSAGAGTAATLFHLRTLSARRAGPAAGEVFELELPGDKDFEACRFRARIPWAHLWLAEEGVALVCLGLHVLARVDAGGVLGVPTLKQASRLLLQCRLHSHRAEARVCRDGGGNEGQRLWNDLVLDGLLSGIARRGTKPSARPWIRTFRHAHALLFAPLDIEPGALASWLEPCFGIAVSLDGEREGFATSVSDERMALLETAREARCPRFIDRLAYDLATGSVPGTSWRGGNPSWEPDENYLRERIDRGAIRIWQGWCGVAVSDATALVSWRRDAPLEGQVESRVYFLFALAVLEGAWLHEFSRRLVDSELMNRARMRELSNALATFRSRFMFREPTVDHSMSEVFRAMRAAAGLDQQFDAVKAELEDNAGLVERKLSWLREFGVLVLAPLLIFGEHIPRWGNEIAARLETRLPAVAQGEPGQWFGVAIVVGGFVVVGAALAYLWVPIATRLLPGHWRR